MCLETGTIEAGWVERDAMRGGNTGGCTLIIGNKFMRKQTVEIYFSDEDEKGGHIQSENWGKGDIPMFWKAKKKLEAMSEHVAQKMGTEARKLKKLSFSGESRTTVKVTPITAEQRESAREVKGEKSTSPKSEAKKVSFSTSRRNPRCTRRSARTTPSRRRSPPTKV